MKNAITYLAILVAMYATGVVHVEAQEKDGTYELVPLGDGSFARTFTPNDPALAEADRMARIRLVNESMKESGVGDIVEFLEATDVESLVSLELLDEQKKEIEEAIEVYRNALKMPEMSGEMVFEMKLNAAQKIHKVLLPEQRRSIAEKVNRKKRLFSVLAFSKVGELLKVNSQQKKALKSGCEDLNEAVTAIIERRQKEEAELKQKMLELLLETLDEKQMKALNELPDFDVDGVLKAMKMADVLDDTDLSKLRVK